VTGSSVLIIVTDTERQNYEIFDASIGEGPDGADYYKTIIDYYRRGVLPGWTHILVEGPDACSICRGRSTEKNFSGERLHQV
jgi:hypothetical protein